MNLKRVGTRTPKLNCQRARNLLPLSQTDHNASTTAVQFFIAAISKVDSVQFAEVFGVSDGLNNCQSLIQKTFLNSFLKVGANFKFDGGQPRFSLGGRRHVSRLETIGTSTTPPPTMIPNEPALSARAESIPNQTWGHVLTLNSSPESWSP